MKNIRLMMLILRLCIGAVVIAAATYGESKAALAALLCLMMIAVEALAYAGGRRRYDAANVLLDHRCENHRRR